MAITINGSGTITGISAGGLPDGSVTAADLASSGTFPAWDGSALTGISAGKVLQVVQGTYSTETTNSSGTVATGVEATITPSSTSSKILVMGNLNGTQFAGGVSSFWYLRRGGSTYIGPSSGFFGQTYSSGGTNVENSIFVYLDSPATTSSTLYQIMNQHMAGTSSGWCNNNCTSTMTLLEIAG